MHSTWKYRPGWLLVGLTTCLPVQVAEGFDFSGLDRFWETVDILSDDRMPTEAEWQRLFEHPGYIQIEQAGQRAEVLEDVMPLVFMPSRRKALDSMLAGTDGSFRNRLRRRVGSHLARVRDMRAELVAFADDLRRSELIGAGYRRALDFLPEGDVMDVPRPPVYVILFEQNGFGGSSVAIDLLAMMEQSEEGLLGFVGHELHHAYLGRIERHRDDASGEDFSGVLNSLHALWFEGVASLIDKSMFLDSVARGALPEQERGFANQYAEWYLETPRVLARVDSMLSGIASGALDAVETGRTMRQMLPSGGHPNGMYMAAAIERQGGRRALTDIKDPVTFVLRYQESAQSASVSAFEFSDETVRFLQGLRHFYLN